MSDSRKHILVSILYPDLLMTQHDGMYNMVWYNKTVLHQKLEFMKKLLEVDLICC